MSSGSLDEIVEGLAVTVGKRLRAQRALLGRTVAAVALDAGLSLPYVANLENGRGNPTLDTLSRLAHALDTSLPELLSDAAAGPVADEPLPPSLLAFTRTKEFNGTCDRLAKAQRLDADQLRARIIHMLAVCPLPRRISDPRRNYQRLLDAWTLTMSPT